MDHSLRRSLDDAAVRDIKQKGLFGGGWYLSNSSSSSSSASSKFTTVLSPIWSSGVLDPPLYDLRARDFGETILPPPAPLPVPVAPPPPPPPPTAAAAPSRGRWENGTSNDSPEADLLSSSTSGILTPPTYLGRSSPTEAAAATVSPVPPPALLAREGRWYSTCTRTMYLLRLLLGRGPWCARFVAFSTTLKFTREGSGNSPVPSSCSSNKALTVTNEDVKVSKPPPLMRSTVVRICFDKSRSLLLARVTSNLRLSISLKLDSFSSVRLGRNVVVSNSLLMRTVRYGS
mmetsp:Transcript_27195/g.45601  ORF Transcript_27195/g.45601 Transcript_27195/m.45601 type:complete len:288 (-) Transcript_27195:310-1173(-)